MKKIFVILIIFLLITRETQSIFPIETIMGKFSFSESILKYMFKKKFVSSCSLAENRDSAKDETEDRNFYNSSVRDQKMIDAQKKIFVEYNISVIDEEIDKIISSGIACKMLLLNLQNKKDKDQTVREYKKFLKNTSSKKSSLESLYISLNLMLDESKQWKSWRESFTDEEKGVLKVIEKILFSDKPSIEEILQNVRRGLPDKISAYLFREDYFVFIMFSMIDQCVKKGHMTHDDLFFL